MHESTDRLLEQGEIKGLVRMLAGQLTHKFGTPLPKAVRDRLEEASSDELDAWSIAFITAPTLEDVFRAKPSGAR